MGTRSTHDSSTDYGDGNWTNPQIQAENQRAIYQQNQEQAELGRQDFGYGRGVAYRQTVRAHEGYLSQAQTVPVPTYPVPFTSPPVPANPYSARAPYRIFRRFFCCLLAVFTLLTGLVGSTCYWTQVTIVDNDNFTAMTEGLAKDQDFQKNLVRAVTDDIMASPTIATYLGDGHSDTWYGQAQNWLYDQTHKLVDDSTNKVVTSERYPELWSKAMSDTHTYDFSGQSRPAILDFSAIYDEAGSSVQTATGLTIDTSSLPGRTIRLDTGESVWPINASINTLIWFASLWPILLVSSAVSALLGFLLWPGSKFAHLACIAIIGAGLLWVIGLIGGGASWLSELGQGSNSGLLFFQKLSQIIADSFASYHKELAFAMLITAVVLVLLAIMKSLFRMIARPATARIR